MRAKIAIELCRQVDRIVLVTAADMGRRAARPAAKLSDHGLLVFLKPLAFQIIVLIEHLDELIELAPRQRRAKPLRENFSKIAVSMAAVEMGQKKITNR